VTSEYSTLLSTLKTALPGWKIIPGSYVGAMKDWPLPAVILDLENPLWDSQTEDGAISETGVRFSLNFYANLDTDDPTIHMKKIEAGIDTAMPAIVAAFPRLAIYVDLPIYSEMPFGKTQIAPAVSFFLRITNGD
jgi:hypothetical protein